ncbi:MAG: hypothetical protein QNJ36_01255 [Calothrix sp. MO_167.B42]|nr:hypothetical protein [Calothrix sp. MO_167.B42]
MQRQKQKRIVLPQELVPKADNICAQTGITSHSQLMALLLQNYGDRLVAALKK